MSNIILVKAGKPNDGNAPLPTRPEMTESERTALIPADYYTEQNKAAYKEYKAIRAILLNKAPFFGVLTMYLGYVENSNIPTMQTNGIWMEVNPNFFMKVLKPGERMFAMIHEVVHGAFKHCSLYRTGGRQLELWGKAIDFFTNSECKKSGIGDFITSIEILFHEMFDGWSVERIYEYLKNNECPQTGQSGNKPQSGNDGGTLDQHVYIKIKNPGDGDQDGEGEGDGEGKDGGNQNGDGKGGITIELTQEQADALAGRWTDAIQQGAAAQFQAEQEGRAAGHIPAGIRRMIDGLIKPKIRWQDALAAFMQQVLSLDYSYEFPEPGPFQDGITIPGFQQWDDELEISVSVDLSGSIGQEDSKAFMSELRGILDVAQRFKVDAWCFDGDVHPSTHQTIDQDSREKFMDFVMGMSGGGGTSFNSNWRYMRQKDMRPRVFLMFTDGCPGDGWGEPNYCPTLFLVKGNPDVKAPFGVTLHYEKGS